MEKGNPQNNHALIFAASVAVVIVLIVVAILARQSPNRSAMESVSTTILCPAPLREVAPNICDDDVDTAYLVNDNSHYLSYGQALEHMIALKKNWQRKFPTKHLVTMIRTEQSSGGNSILMGVLIHYNNESK